MPSDLREQKDGDCGDILLNDILLRGEMSSKWH